MKAIFRLLAVLVLMSIMLVAGTGAGIALDRQVLAAPKPEPSIPAPNFQLITEAWNDIQRVYVDRSAEQPQTLTYGAISGMVDALGDTGHSTFLSPAMVKSEQDFTQGQFEGIGAEVQSVNGQVVIVAPIDGSPAQHAGIHAGDVILKVNGADVTGLPLEQVIGQILGPAGSSVRLTILEPSSGKTSELTLVRARITLQNVTWQQLPGTTIADVRIAGFSQGESADLTRALTQIQRQGMTGVILDLRNDPGGLLSEAIQTTSQFLNSGDVLLEKDAQGHIAHLAVKNGGVATKIPMVVLVNGGTASASEIVAGALQDAHRATILGETTFGTGTVLSEFSLSDGSALMLATEEWLTPNGRVIWHKGIAPDQAVTLASSATPLTPEGERNMTADQVKNSGDLQVLRAVSLLSASALENKTVPSASPAQAQAASASALAIDLNWLKQFGLV